MKLAPMPQGGFQIEAADLGPLLDLEPAAVPELMRAGHITSLSETGEGSDAGRFRVTFRHGTRRVRLTLTADGTVIATSRFTVSAISGTDPAS